jgi:hypothetical protein
MSAFSYFLSFSFFSLSSSSPPHSAAQTPLVVAVRGPRGQAAHTCAHIATEALAKRWDLPS